LTAGALCPTASPPLQNNRFSKVRALVGAGRGHGPTGVIILGDSGGRGDP